jgi:hypothetical protein
MGNPYTLSLLFDKKNREVLYSDLSLWMLILSNLLTILWALIEGWSVGLVMWSYWCHSVSIGILWFFKILCLKNFSTKDVEIPIGRPAAPTTSTKIQVAVFFVIHYGIFHWGYSNGLRTFFPSIRRDAVLPIAVVFFVTQCFSFFYNRKWDEAPKSNIGTVMLFPYLRIIPMHLSFILGGFVVSEIGGTSSSRIIMVIFMLLKTFADIFTHAAERRGFGAKARSLRRHASRRRIKARTATLHP